MTEKIRSFTDLVAWQESHKLVLLVYKLSKNFPKEELFALTSQIRRAVISIVSNIAEGFSRGTSKDKNQFYLIALGSLAELQSQLLVARDLGYLTKSDFTQVANQTVIVRKLLSGLLRSSQSYRILNTEY